MGNSPTKTAITLRAHEIAQSGHEVNEMKMPAELLVHCYGMSQ